MSSDKNIEIVRRYLAEVVSRGNFDVAEQLLAPDLVFTSPYTPEPVRDRDGFKQMIGGLRASFPDLRIEEVDAFGGGDRVATRWTASGTHTGAPFLGQPPLGRSFHIAGISIYRLTNGRIVEGWVHDDVLGMLTQLGVVEAPRAL